MPVQAHNNPALQQGSTIGLRPLTRELTWLWHLPLVLVLGWWILDLQVQWRTLPEFQHGWLVVPLAAHLAWERRDRRPAFSPPRSALRPVFVALVLGAVL